MKLFFDTYTGTYGVADHLRICDMDYTEDDFEIFDEMTDSERNEYGLTWGRPVS